MKRIPQPPVNPALRHLEQHDFWPGFIVALIGGLLLFCGARHMTNVETTDGATAGETQLIRAFAFGGLRFPSQVAPPPPPQLDDPAAAAEALDRWAKEQANAQPPTWRVRVDVGAAAPCPT